MKQTNRGRTFLIILKRFWGGGSTRMFVELHTPRFWELFCVSYSFETCTLLIESDYFLGQNTICYFSPLYTTHQT